MTGARAKDRHPCSQDIVRERSWPARRGHASGVFTAVLGLVLGLASIRGTASADPSAWRPETLDPPSSAVLPTFLALPPIAARQRLHELEHASQVDSAPGEPTAARPLSPPTHGVLKAGVRLPRSVVYDLRCRYNAHAARFTAAHLFTGLARLRARYPGQIVIGDVSRKHGGPFGKHRSHQSGRDVDIWLPIRGGSYRTAPECSRCGNSWCRPQRDEIDWPGTWALIRALAATGAVEHVFLDRALHPELRAAALAAGAAPGELRRLIQRRPGARALILHSAGHFSHIHVRFVPAPEQIAP